MKKIFFIHLIVVLQLLSFIESFSADDFWWKTTGPYGAKISKIAIDTIKGNNYIYLATKTDGVYRSTNGGTSWLRLHDDTFDSTLSTKMWHHERVNDIVIGSTGIIYAATDSRGIFKRVSATWSKKAVPNNPIIHCIYILSNGYLLAGTNDKSIARSTNSGDNWSSITTGLSSVTNVYGIVQANNGNIFIGTDQGIYKSNSVDNGGSWASQDITPGKVNCMAKSSDGLILMAGSDKGVYASSNNGDSWNLQVAGMPANTKVISLAYHKDGYFIAGTESNGLFYTNPSTYTWNAYNTGLEATRIRAVATSPTGELFAGTNFAFYKSPDNSSSWESYNSGLGLRTINRFASLAFKADVLAATDLGIYKTTNSGVSWTQLNQGLGDYHDITALVVARNGYYFAGTKGDGLYYSTNQGDDWIKLPANANFTATDVTTLDTNSQGILWAGTKTQGVFKSNDITGMSWSRGNGDNIENLEILSFVTAANDVTYAGTANDGLYRKADGVNSWGKVPAGYLGIALNTIYSLAYIDIGVNGIVYAATNSGIRRSNDNSLGPWYSPTGSLNGAAIAITSCENGWVLVSTKNKAIYIDSTTKNGDSLHQFNVSGLNNVNTLSLAVSGRGYIFAGTEGNSCYRSINSTSAKILVVNTKQSDTLEVQQGDKVNLSVEIIDGLDQKVQGADIIVNNDLGLTIGDLTTDASGLASVEVTIPTNLPDNPKGEYYTVTFKASKIGHIESEIKTVYIHVERQKIKLEIVPNTEQFRDWERPYNYDIIAKDGKGNALQNMTVYVDDELTGNKQTLTTDTEGKTAYSDIVPDNHPEQAYNITFVGEDATGYFKNDTVIRVVTVDHNDIIIDGEQNVCLNSSMTYSTEPDADKSFVWKLVGGTFKSGTTGTLVNILWDKSGQGELTLEQTIISTQDTTSRTLYVTVFDLPVVTLDPFNTPVCPNEPFDLSTVTVSPAGGVFSGPGVVDGIFYGDQAGAGTHPIIYTAASDVEPYCVNSDTTIITVSALPNVTLVLDSTVFCKSYFPFPLTGGKLNGVDVDGEYSGKGVSGNILDPTEAGVGTHEITFSYTDGTTGCTNTAKQNITINDAPIASIIVPNTDVCESETSFRLDTFATVPGTFYLNDSIPVIIPNGIFDASKVGLGEHRIEFYTDEKIGNCPGMAYVNLNVVSVPGKPTITATTSSLSSDSDTGNTWYRRDLVSQKDTMIAEDEGRKNKTIIPEISGLYSVAVSNGNCESFHSNSVSFTAIPASGSFATEASESGEIEPGKEFTIDIKIGNTKDIKDKQINRVTTDLVYNASLMYPLDSVKGTVTDHRRTIPLEIAIDYNNVTQGTKLRTLNFQATVGSEVSTELQFKNVKAWSDTTFKNSEIEINNIWVEIKVNKEGGRSRLYGEPPTPLLLANIKPNPVNENFVLDYSFQKDNWLKIYITNLNGNILKNIYEDVTTIDENSIEIHVAELQTGAYYLILQTVYSKEAIPLHIIK